MVNSSEWSDCLGGGTDLNITKKPELMFNQMNKSANFDDLEVIDTYPFESNQAVLFVKTFNSWHSVRPMTGTDSSKMRRSLTVNILEGI